MSYLPNTDERPEGCGFTGGGGGRSGIRAIDHKTDTMKWMPDTARGAQGLFTTAGHLLF